MSLERMEYNLQREIRRIILAFKTSDQWCLSSHSDLMRHVYWTKKERYFTAFADR